MKKIFKKWWFWLIVTAFLATVFLLPMFNCSNCAIFPDRDGKIKPHGRCCQSLVDFILGNEKR